VAKYRPHKIKLRHHVLAALRADLDRIAAYDAVDAITPGAIKPKRGASVGFTLQYVTPSGLKLIGRSGGAAQEVFVVTARPAEVTERLRRDGILEAPPDGMPPG
jgi:hypothetical protein